MAWRDMKFSEDDMQKGNEVGERIDRIMRGPIDDLIELLMERGLEDWEIAIGLQFAAFRALEYGEADWKKAEFGECLEGIAKRLTELLRQKGT